jgi:hypothetical protein
MRITITITRQRLKDEISPSPLLRGGNGIWLDG